MDCVVDDIPVHFVQHGEGTAVLVLHGAGVDHREAEACFEPALDMSRLRRIYPDLPGMGRTPAPEWLCSADQLCDVMLDFADAVAGSGAPFLLVGHSAGAYYAQGMAARRPDQVVGLALVCPLLAGVRDVPSHRPVVASELGDEGFRGYFVLQTPEMLDRYERFVAPAIQLVDEAAVARIGERWELSATRGPAYDQPMVIVAGRHDSTVGYAAAVDLAADHPRGSLAVLDRAGHALPHEQPTLLAALLGEWLARVEPAL